MIILMSMVIFALAYAAKGGWLGRIPQWKNFEYSDELKRVVPAFIIFFWVVWFVPFWACVLFTAAFCFCYSSMGEEAGAVGDYTGGWGDYLTAVNPDGSPSFGRSYGVKKALQWGLAWGGLLALASGFVWFVLAGALFPVCYFVGSSIAAFRGQKGWAYAEPIFGAVMGLFMGVWLNGL